MRYKMVQPVGSQIAERLCPNEILHQIARKRQLRRVEHLGKLAFGDDPRRREPKIPILRMERQQLLHSPPRALARHHDDDMPEIKDLPLTISLRDSTRSLTQRGPVSPEILPPKWPSGPCGHRHESVDRETFKPFYPL